MIAEGQHFKIHHGKSEEVLREYPDNFFDSVVCDPPYHLTSIVKRFGGANAAPAQFGTDGAFARAAKGFIGKEWDGGDIAFRPDFWAEIWRVLKPGGHLIAFSGSRTYHRMAVGIEDAGFEIRDQIMYIYGSGFPKSHDVSKGIDKAAGVEREVIGRANGAASSDTESLGEFKPHYDLTAPATEAARQWQGWGTALKPAHEPMVLARKPLAGTVAQNVLEYGTGAINVDGCRIEGADAEEGRSRHGGGLMQGASYQLPDSISSMPAGRWPANIIHDGSDEVVKHFPQDMGDSAARFFYCAKASKEDRDEGLAGQVAGVGAMRDGGRESQPRFNTHPTVKPTDLMRYLCRLVTPPGGLILDPFMGSGSTGKAAMLEGFRFVGIDMTEEYIGIARARIQHAYDQRNNIAAIIQKESAKTGQLSIFDALTPAELPPAKEPAA